jgi:hypothetical protein
MHLKKRNKTWIAVLGVSWSTGVQAATIPIASNNHLGTGHQIPSFQLGTVLSKWHPKAQEPKMPL